MKKLLLIAVVFALSLTAVFAENTFNVGTYFPLSSLTANEQEFTTRGFGAFVDYTHIAEKGFTFKLNAGIARAMEEGLSRNIKGLDLDGTCGFGYSPLHNDKMFLSIYLDAGARLQAFSEEYSKTDLITVFMPMFYTGPEVSYTFRFNEHVGICANLGIFYSVGTCEVERGREVFEEIFSGFTFQPKVGITFTL